MEFACKKSLSGNPALDFSELTKNRTCFDFSVTCQTALWYCSFPLKQSWLCQVYNVGYTEVAWCKTIHTQKNMRREMLLSMQNVAWPNQHTTSNIYVDSMPQYMNTYWILPRMDIYCHFVSCAVRCSERDIQRKRQNDNACPYTEVSGYVFVPVFCRLSGCGGSGNTVSRFLYRFIFKPMSHQEFYYGHYKQNFLI